MSNPWLFQSPCDPYEGETEVSTVDRQRRDQIDIEVVGLLIDAGMSFFDRQEYGPKIAAFVARAEAEAERRGAENAWEAGWQAGLNYSALGIYQTNPYRAGADQ